jgi:hypothetical protein
MDAEANIRAANGPKGKRQDCRASSLDFAGNAFQRSKKQRKNWIPAYAGMTKCGPARE